MQLEDLLPFNTTSLLTLIDSLQVLAIELLVVQTSRIPTDARTLSAGDFEFLRRLSGFVFDFPELYLEVGRI